MKRISKIISFIICAATMCSLFTACGKNDSKVTVRYLNFKPEAAETYEKIAKEYEKEKGIKVVIETAANNQYESTLTAKMATKDAPTIFQINGPKGYAN